MLERALCSQEEPDFLSTTSPQGNNNNNNSNSSSSSSATITATTTTTTAVQTDSPLLKKARPDQSASCSSLERLGSDCSDEVSPMAEEGQGGLGRAAGCVAEIVCQSGGLPETATSDPAAPCPPEGDDSATRQAAHGTASLRNPKNLNKSDSNDSGLHSDAVSTSDSQFTISSSDSNHLICQSGLSSPLLSPSMDEVLELCMEQAESEGLEFPARPRASGGQRGPPGEGQAGERACPDQSDETPAARIEPSVSAEAESGAASPCEEGSCVCGKLATEEEEEEAEERFYTPSTGVSPLHRPSADGAAQQASRLSVSPVMGALLHLAASGVSLGESSGLHSEACVGGGSSLQVQDGVVRSPRDEDVWNSGELAPEGADSDCVNPGDCDDDDEGDEDKENRGSQGDGATSTGRNGGESGHASQPFYSVLQKVQAIFSPSQAVAAGEPNGAGDACGLSGDSLLTDPTLTDLTPPSDTTTTLTPPSSDDPSLGHFCPPSDSCDSAMHCAAPSHCDSNSSNSTLQAPCDNESQNQKITRGGGSGQPSSGSGVTSSDNVANPSLAAAGGDSISGAPSAVEPVCGLTQKQCDRCTQTPHSVINNDQSSKIHHHHHHHHHSSRQHSSNPSVTCSAPSLPSTAQGSACSVQGGPKSRGEKRDTSNNAATPLAPVKSRSSQSQSSQKRMVEKGQKKPGDPRGYTAKARKMSHRSETRRFRALKPRLGAPESEVRLKQHADNWSDCSSNGEGDAKGGKKVEWKPLQGVVETSSGSSGCEGASSTSDCESDQDR